MHFLQQVQMLFFLPPRGTPRRDRLLGAALTEDKRPTGRPDLPAIIMAVVAVVATLVIVPVVIVPVVVVVTVVR